MAQNKNKLIKSLIGNLANSIVHRILEKSITNSEITKKYQKEAFNSLEISKKYREKINPINEKLQEKDIDLIKDKVTSRVKSEISLRISKGYSNLENIDIESEVAKALKDLTIA